MICQSHTRQYEAKDTPPPTKSILKKSKDMLHEQSLQAAKEALTEFEGQRVQQQQVQPNGLFNPKYQRLSGINASIRGMGRPSSQTAKESKKKKGKKTKADELTSSVWSIDYGHFEMSRQQQDTSDETTPSSVKVCHVTSQSPPAQPRPNIDIQITGPDDTTLTSSSQSQEYQLREYDIETPNFMTMEEFQSHIPSTDVNDYGTLEQSSNQGQPLSADCLVLESTFKFLGTDHPSISSRSTCSPLVTFNESQRLSNVDNHPQHPILAGDTESQYSTEPTNTDSPVRPTAAAAYTTENTDNKQMNTSSSNIAEVHPTSSNIAVVQPTSSNIEAVKPTSSNIAEIQSTSNNIVVVQPTSSNIAEVHPTSNNIAVVQADILTDDSTSSDSIPITNIDDLLELADLPDPPPSFLSSSAPSVVAGDVEFPSHPELHGSDSDEYANSSIASTDHNTEF